MQLFSLTCVELGYSGQKSNQRKRLVTKYASDTILSHYRVTMQCLSVVYVFGTVNQSDPLHQTFLLLHNFFFTI